MTESVAGTARAPEQQQQPAATRAPHLLMALIDRAIAFGNGHLNDVQFENAQREMVDALVVVCRQARAFMTYQAAIPTTIDEALRLLRANQHLYQDASADYLSAFALWGVADAQSSRIRLRCVEALMTPVDQGGQGFTYSRADKEASRHPDYAEHKDRLQSLTLQKVALEAQVKCAEEDVRNARAILQAVITGGQMQIIKGETTKRDRGEK